MIHEFNFVFITESGMHSTKLELSSKRVSESSMLPMNISTLYVEVSMLVAGVISKFISSLFRTVVTELGLAMPRTVTAGVTPSSPGKR